jgi:hypothetical protein
MTKAIATRLSDCFGKVSHRSASSMIRNGRRTCRPTRPIPVHEEREHKRVAAAARAAPGDAAFDRAWREASAMGWKRPCITR